MEEKDLAIKNMNLLWLGSDIVENFKNGNITFLGRTGFPEVLYRDSYCCRKVVEFENKYNCIVYAVIHSDFGYGACYSFLYIPEYKEDWQYLIMPYESLRQFVCQAYVWNRSFSELSEFGSIIVYAPGKRLQRLG